MKTEQDVQFYSHTLGTLDFHQDKMWPQNKPFIPAEIVCQLTPQVFRVSKPS